MNVLGKRAGTTAIVFLVGAIVLFALAFWEGRSGEVLSIPVQLTSEATITREFIVPFTGHYDVSVEFSRTLPHEQLTQLLSGENVIDAEVAHDGEKLPVRKYFPPPRPSPSPYARGPENPTSDIGNLAFSNDWIAQTIISFPAQRGKHYRVFCNVLRADADLLKTNPRLVIAMDVSEYMGGLVPTASFLIGGILAAICTLVAATVYVFQIRKERQSKPERH